MTHLAASPTGPVTLTGVHVRLEPLSLEHVEPLLLAALEDRSTYRWTTVPDSESAMREYVSGALDLAARNEVVPFVTRLAEGGRVVGTTRFANFEYHGWPVSHRLHRPEGQPDAVEIGWTWLAASAQRTPVNTEAKLLMLRHAFETWRVHCVRLKTDRRNERSRAAIERIGGRFDGIIRAHSPGADGSLRDSAYFSILAEEWPEVERGLCARLGFSSGSKA
jgi:RimJ/RimL family protein N-acetyltransferase